jgi:hypothetical protein
MLHFLDVDLFIISSNLCGHFSLIILFQKISRNPDSSGLTMEFLSWNHFFSIADPNMLRILAFKRVPQAAL